MPELTEAQIEVYRERLLELKKTIEAALLQSAGERPIEKSGSTIGRLSRMDAMQVQAMGQLGRSQLEVRLQRIDGALHSVRSGWYGLCRECKEAISLKRLDAMPEAPFCVPCQESFE